jgi:hypothetical protein
MSLRQQSDAANEARRRLKSLESSLLGGWQRRGVLQIGHSDRLDLYKEAIDAR